MAVQADKFVGASDAFLAIDDTGLPKKGDHSVGVAPQYASMLGKRANCQTLVSLTPARICKGTGYPKTIRVDNGSEFISRDLDLWAYANNVTLDFSRPGKPTDNGFIEAFNSKLRAECLNAHWFLTLADSREKLETWRQYYNPVS